MVAPCIPGEMAAMFGLVFIILSPAQLCATFDFAVSGNKPEQSKI